MSFRGLNASTLLSLALGACSDDGLTAMQEEASEYATFQRVNAQPFRTAQHQGNPDVNVWTNDVATEPYRILSSDASSRPEFPIGSIIVKEMLDAAGAPAILTVMAKQPSGFDPEHQDWWYGRLEVDGTATNRSFVGKVAFFIACHTGAGPGYVFGVAADNLSPLLR